MKENLVITPTYNEIENVELIIRAVMNLETSFDMLIVDDGSPDGTGQKVKELIKEFPNRLFLEERTEKNGLGTAYIHGFKWALERDYQFIYEMDADFSHNPNDLEKLYKACKEDGFDMSIGSRYKSGVNVVNWPMGRVLMSYFASKYVQFVTGLPINDTTAGFKCYTNKVLNTILTKDTIHFVGYAFQIEMKFKTWMYGYKIKEVPIVFTDRTRGTSKMSTSIFKEAFFGVITLKIRSYFRKFQA
ncbi:polyprenol monophosphomannose synthase [Flammeovirga sp. OC4]|uniref:polyprenol monophosphomannose synthase n=1 Tax=unclassified Flammeovirga TaxID=2637820 RepID=UPI0005C59F66|nr:polyprenol monophosphomannose synthase [Flammeovirga sp. OC4]MBD0401659.1 polyprenol monophosphomannose synthase [Flammeovirga sp. EKP202]